MDFETVSEEVEVGRVLRYQLHQLDRPLGFRQFISSLSSDAKFRQHFNTLLVEAPFDAYRFETPALSTYSLDDPFEFVLINAPGLLLRTADAVTFDQYFKDAGEEVVEFKGLGGDATLLVPVPGESHEACNHLAMFVRCAPESQVEALWEMVGKVLMREVGTKPVWFNTEGSGVAWLHVRIDSRPKYYGYANYTVVTVGAGKERLV